MLSTVGPPPTPSTECAAAGAAPMLPLSLALVCNPGAGTRIDWFGLALLSAGLTAVVLALVQSQEWSAAAVVGLALGGLGCLAAFWVIEHRVREPIVICSPATSSSGSRRPRLRADVDRGGGGYAEEQAGLCLVGAGFTWAYVRDIDDSSPREPQHHMHHRRFHL
jgi:hypothetical protein